MMAEHSSNPDVHQAERLTSPSRVSEQSWPEGTQPLVSILCAVYNQETFIEQCLEGFLMQETTFPVEVIIQDDASTDRTQEIIREYCSAHPRLLRPFFYQTNQLSKGIKPWSLAFRHARGAYIATCDGDDFWSLPSKLEQQVRILESEPACFLCGGRVFVVRDGCPTPYTVDPSVEPDRLNSMGPMEMLRGQWTMRTLSRMARRAVWEEYLRIAGDDPAACDFLFSLYCISRSKMNPAAFRCLDEVVGTYREHPAGIWHSASEEKKLMANLAVFLFALQHFDFGEQRRVMEAGFIHVTEQLGLTADMHPAAHTLYLELKAARAPAPHGPLRRMRSAVARLLGGAPRG